MSIRRKALILVTVPLCFGLLLLMVLIWLTSDADRAAKRESDSKQIISEISASTASIVDCAQSVVLFSLTRDVRWSERFGTLEQDARQHLRSLNSSTVLSPAQQTEIDSLMHKVFRLLDEMEQTKVAFERRDFSSPYMRPAFLKSRVTSSLPEIAEHMRRLTEAESQRSRQLVAGETRFRFLVMQSLVAGCALNFFFCTALSIFFTNSILRRLSVISDNARRFKDQHPLRAPLTGADEIAEVDRVFHEMAQSVAISTEREKAIVDNTVDVICSLNDNLGFQRVSRAALTMWNLEPGEMTNIRLIDLIADTDRAQTAEKLEILKHTSVNAIFEARVVRANGSLQWTRWSVSWLESDKTYFCVAHDIHEEKLAEQMKRDFVNMVSHDLRTPLMSVTAFLETIAAGKSYGSLTDKGQTFAKALRQSLAHLLSLLSTMLDIDKLETGHEALNIERAELSLLIKQAVDSVDGLAQAKGVSITISGCEEEVSCDPGRLVQVIQNLLSNAIKFTPKGKEIQITTEILDAYEIQFNVFDQGPGIAETEAKVIFDRFCQGSGARRGGFGLGLAICKSIIEAHGGTIGVNRTIEGSQFWFKLKITAISVWVFSLLAGQVEAMPPCADKPPGNARTMATKKPGAVETDRLHILIFPDSCFLGDLLIRKNAARSFVGTAKGVVRLPAGSFVELELVYGARECLRKTRSKPIGSIQSIKATLAELADDDLVFLNEIKDLRELDLSHCMVGKISLDPVAKHVELEALQLKNTALIDATVASIGNLEKLRHLSIADTRVTANGLWRLTRLKNLQSLNLSGTAIDDRLQAISSLKSIIKLDLGDTNVGVDHSTLGRVLTSLPALQELNLKSTKVTDDLSPYLGEMKQLASLNLSRTSISSKSLPALAMLSNLRGLDLSDCAHIGLGAGKYLSQCLGLVSLDVSDTSISPSDLEQVTRIPGLKLLRARHIGAKPELIAAVKLKFPLLKLMTEEIDEEIAMEAAGPESLSKKIIPAGMPVPGIALPVEKDPEWLRSLVRLVLERKWDSARKSFLNHKASIKRLSADQCVRVGAALFSIGKRCQALYFEAASEADKAACLAEAERYYLYSLDCVHRAAGSKNSAIKVIECCDYLGIGMTKTWHGMFSNGEPFLRRSLALATKNHIPQTVVLTALGDCLEQQRKYKDARNIFKQAQRRPAAESQPVQRANSFEGEARCLAAMHKYEQAAGVYQSALNSIKKLPAEKVITLYCQLAEMQNKSDSIQECAVSAKHAIELIDRSYLKNGLMDSCRARCNVLLRAR